MPNTKVKALGCKWYSLLCMIVSEKVSSYFNLSPTAWISILFHFKCYKLLIDKYLSCFNMFKCCFTLGRCSPSSQQIIFGQTVQTRRKVCVIPVISQETKKKVEKSPPYPPFHFKRKGKVASKGRMV